ncbi:MAG: non-canonical purine NTP pyrophosphatase, partial [Candidatus Glassbacteria bacterium]|nr:non-canonical purine NTP pyrophosphatase [Candidatus Glassbacteria bacterium]
KYFLADLGTAGLVRALEPCGDFRAEAVSTIGYHDGESVHLFEGRMEGMIVPPRGDHGFGWDAIFQPRGASVTYGEMAPQTKRLHSMRALAFQALAEFLKG